jgi:hypothetical protein
MKLFDAVASAGEAGISIEKIASKTDAEPLLILRIARALAAVGILKETSREKFASTLLSKAWVSSSPFTQGIIHITHQNTVVDRLPEYFEHHGYKNPGDAFNGPFQYAFNTKEHVFEWLANNPKYQHAFNIVMTMAIRGETQKWFEVFPVGEKLRAGSDSDVALVDIGGGVGHDLIALKEAHPELQGKLVLEDLPVVISSAKDLPSGIEALPHDMFQPQPIKSAKAYFLRNVLHDWPDKQASIVLSHIHEAMDSDSLLLISESLMPEEKVPFYNVAADLSMMAAFSALDRTEAQFQQLIESCGFELVKVWKPDGFKPGAAVVFEARKR